MGARRYILRRLFHAVPVLFFVSVIVFLVLHLSPGDPAVQMYGAQPGVTKDMIEAARREMGLDKPWVEQYFFWLANLLRGDMGESYVNHLPVRTVIGQKLPASLELAVASLALAVLVAVPGGIISAVKHGSRIESFLTAFITLGIAIPSFWLGIIMVLVFAVGLGLVPPSGYAPIDQAPGQNLRFLSLPASTMAILIAAGSESPDRFDYDPAHPLPTIGGNHSNSPEYLPAGPFDQRAIEMRADMLVYTSVPLTSDVEVTGPVQARLYVASSARDTDFTARLVDVLPNGFAMNLCEGIIRCKYRNSWEQPELMTPNSAYEVTVDLGVTSHVFRAGHRIRLDVSSSSFPRFDRNLNTGEPIARATRMQVAHQSVLHSTECPSRVILPMVPPSG